MSDIHIPPHCKQIDFENELGIVLGEPLKNATADRARGAILAYTIANDVSARDWQKREVSGGQFSYAKSFDTFCPFGPFLVAVSEVMNPSKLVIKTRVNGVTMQEVNTSQMIFDVGELISFLSRGTTLPKGCLILTGTPTGVGAAQSPPFWLQNGDVVECEIEGLGTLKNKVITT